VMLADGDIVAVGVGVGVGVGAATLLLFAATVTPRCIYLHLTATLPDGLINR